MALILMLGLVTLFTFHMERRGPELEADRKTAMALAQAKEAILGRAIINGIPTGTVENPGALPCPDRDDDGQTDNTPTQCIGGGVSLANLPENAGRVPLQTLDVDELRDGAGERLWYILTPEFVDQGNINPINTLLIPSLTIVENGIPRTVVGVIISPGRPLVGQDRTAKNVLANYVEGYNDATKTLTISPTSAVYNDRLLEITRQDLFTKLTFRMARDLASQNSPSYPPFLSSLSKSTVWNDNNWSIAVFAYAPTTPPNSFALTFQNCAITYTVTGLTVTRNLSSC